MLNSTNLKYELPEITMESFYDMRNAQPAKDRLHYFDVALEGSAETNALLLQKLYTDILAKSNIDYGQIPDSEGNLTKYSGYKLMAQSLSSLNEIFKGMDCEELKITNKLHDMIISCRKDFDFGYKFDIEIVKVAYCTSVLTLYQMINICIMIYTKKIQKNAGINIDLKKFKKKNILVIRGAKSLLKSYETGQWSRMIAEMKKDPSFIGDASTSSATEALVDMNVNVGSSKLPVKSIGDAFAAGKAFAGNFVSAHPILANGGKIVVMIIGVLVAIRVLVYVFWRGTVKINDWAKNQKEFLDCTIRQEQEDGTSAKTLEKHKKLATRLESLSNWIEVRILKTNADATKDLQESDRQNFSASDFKAIQTGVQNGGSTIEF